MWEIFQGAAEMSVRVSAVKKQDFRKNCQREKEKNLGTAGL